MNCLNDVFKQIGLGFVLLLGITQPLYAHGENKPGPHNGYIRMPGAYHIEVIPTKNALKIMLLDTNFKNPTVLNSLVKAKIQSGNDEFVLSCKSKSNYFSCPVSKRLLAQEGVLKIESERQLSEGQAVSYPLPLQLKKNN